MAYQIERDGDGFLVRFRYRNKPKTATFAAYSDAVDFTHYLEKRDKARARRRAVDDAYRSAGMVRVRGALGGTYYE